MITAIAAQTNLLALNAAIEAARAGEHGRGFAIVADEVRKLAEQSGEAAQEISGLIASIQEETQTVVAGMRQGTDEVGRGIEAVNTAGRSFEEILTAVRDVTDQIQAVSSSSEQMSASAEQVVESINLIAGVAEETASGAQSISATTKQQLDSMEAISLATNQLSEMAEDLQILIARFKV